MGRGKSQGPPLEYQKLCRAIIQELQFQDNLVPYDPNSDGIDTLFDMCGTQVTIDVALKNPQNDQVVIAECKRYTQKYSIKQDALFALLGKVMCLRAALRTDVQGIFVTSSSYQIGAIKMATEMKIRVAICKSDQFTDDFTIRFVYYDSQRQEVLDEDIGHKKSSISAFLKGSI